MFFPWGAESGQCLDVGNGWWRGVNCPVLERAGWWDGGVCPSELAPAWHGCDAVAAWRWTGAGRAEPPRHGQMPSPGRGWSRPVHAETGTKPRSSYPPRGGPDSPCVTRTLLGFFCLWCTLAPLWWLRKDEHRSVRDAVWKSLDSSRAVAQRGAGVGWRSRLCQLLWRGRGAQHLRDSSWFDSSTFGEPQRESSDRCRAVGSRAGTGKVLIRMLAALVGVGVWLVGSVEQTAQGLLGVVLGVNLQAAGSQRVCGWDEASAGARQSHPGVGGCCLESPRGSWATVGDVALSRGGADPL